MNAKPRVVFSISQALFTLGLLLFFFTILNGYLLNLVSGYRASFWLVSIGVALEFMAVFFVAWRWVYVESDPFELAGFVVTLVGVWIYFIAASLPTLLPPSQSEDAVRVYLQVLFTYPDGKLVSWYPAGGTFFVATLAHWLRWEPLRVLHPTAALFLAMSAGAVYGMTCDLLGKDRLSKIWALIAPTLLFVPWSYFAGIIDWEQYFIAQAFAQLFTLAALWYSISYIRLKNAMWVALLGAALLGVVAAYPVFVALPFGAFAMAVVVQNVLGSVRRTAQPFQVQRSWSEVRPTLVVLGILLALTVLAALALQQGGIIDLNGGRVSATQDVGVGGVTTPSIDTLGGPIFLLLALIGALFAWRESVAGKTLLVFLFIWACQFIALVVLQPIVNLSGYRVDKTFYILVFPFAIFSALAIGRVLGWRNWDSALGTRRDAVLAGLWVVVVLLLTAGVAKLRPPIAFSPLTESELETAQWAKRHLDTYQVNYLDPLPIRAYWVAFGVWRETLPNEWFQWIPAGTKLGPASFDEWFGDPAWGNWLFVRDVSTLGAAPVQIVYHSGTSAIVQKATFVIPTATPSRTLRWHFGSTIKLVGLDPPHEKISAGDTISLTTYTESIYPPPATVAWRLQLVDREGKSLGQSERDPFGKKYPVQRWPQGRVARDEWSLPVDARAGPGVYDVRLGMFRRDGGDFIDAFPVLAEGLGKPVSVVPIARVKIAFPAPSPEELRKSTPLGARVGDNFALSSYALDVDRAARRVHVALYWQNISKSQNDYTVFVHVLDSSGRVIAQIDREPRDGNYPTSMWDAQEIIKDEYDLTIPAAASAPLSIEIGMYAQPSLKRLPVGASDKIIVDLGF